MTLYNMLAHPSNILLFYTTRPHLEAKPRGIIGLSENQIGDAGANELAQHLQGTHVHTIDLSENQIGDATQQLLKKEYPHINWSFL